MRDYEELVASLRLCASNDSCRKCILFDDRVSGDDRCDKAVMRKAASAIEELVSNADKFKWISVEERLPDVNERVLACVSICGEPSVWDAVRWNGKEWEAEKEVVYEYWTSIDFPVTHWMPMPAAPEEGGAVGG